jgi:hypothetical protein
LSEVLPKTKLTAADRKLLSNRQVNIVDGSCVKQEGKNGKLIRIHTNYSLSFGCIEEVTVTDQHTAESFEPFCIKPGSIYMADAGFGKGKNLDYIVSRQADAILRATPNQLSLAKDLRGKEKIDMAAELASHKDIVELDCYIHVANGKYRPVRVIASRLPEDKIAEAIERKKRYARKHQNVVRDATLIYAQWVVLITSLDKSYSALDIFKLYRLRWQIELLFKRIKQMFKITRIKAATIQHSKALVLIWFISWVLTERNAVSAEAVLVHNNADMSLYSQWTLCGYFFHSVKALVYSLIQFCLDCELLCVYKRLQHHKSSRIFQLFQDC